MYDIATETLIVRSAPSLRLHSGVFLSPCYDRIIEIEWAVKNNLPFKPSPKRQRKARPKKGKGAHKVKPETQALELEVATHREDKENCETESSQYKRRVRHEQDCGEDLETPQKKRRVGGDLAAGCEIFGSESAPIQL